MRTTVYLTWKNNLAGHEYFPFVAYHDEGLDILETGQADVNIFPNYPSSYGEFATTITKQTFREAKKTILVRSQYVSRERLEVLKTVKTSTLVQMLTDRYDARTVIPDSDSFTVVRGKDKIFAIQFTLTFTNYEP